MSFLIIMSDHAQDINNTRIYLFIQVYVCMAYLVPWRSNCAFVFCLKIYYIVAFLSKPYHKKFYSLIIWKKFILLLSIFLQVKCINKNVTTETGNNIDCIMKMGIKYLYDNKNHWLRFFLKIEMHLWPLILNFIEYRLNWMGHQ